MHYLRNHWQPGQFSVVEVRPTSEATQCSTRQQEPQRCFSVECLCVRALQVTHIQQNTKIPVLGHADGICHVYVDRDADIQKACAIVVDSKVCGGARSQGLTRTSPAVSSSI